MRIIVQQLGDGVLGRWATTSRILAIAGTACALALRPSAWPVTTRDVLARQVYFTAIEAVRSISVIAAFVGIAIVVQAQVWLIKFGQTAYLGPLLVAVIVRELGPLLTSFVVIGRSGTAVTAELATMRVNREDRVLEAQGVDPFSYLVMPRGLGMMISVLCLTLVFIIVSFFSGYLFGILMGITEQDPLTFAESLMMHLTFADVMNVLAKTLLSGALTGAICCNEGLGVSGATTEVPQAAGRALLRSVFALFTTAFIISLVSYL